MLTPLPCHPGVCELQRQTQRCRPPLRIPEGQHYTHVCQPLRHALQLSRPVATPRYVCLLMAHSQPYVINELIYRIVCFFSIGHFIHIGTLFSHDKEKENERFVKLN